MNVTLKKMALLEKTLQEREGNTVIDNATYPNADRDLQNRVAILMEKVRRI